MTTPEIADNNRRAVPDLADVPGLPRDEEGVVFAAPWEAKAFALIVHLHQRGHFEWPAWVQALSAEIARDGSREQATPYYLLWLTAAENLVTARGLLDADQLSALRQALHAAQASPHDDDHGHDHDHHDHSH